MQTTGSRLAGPLGARSNRAASGPAKRVALLMLLIATGCNERPPAPTSNATAPAAPEPQPQSLPTIAMTLGGKPFKLQVADEDKKREIGLMHRKSMPADEGMIFVFPYEAPRGFWMKNTPIDLDILYVSQTGRIVSIHTMRAYDTRSTPSGGDAKYAIELNAGVAKELGLSVGQVLDIPSGLRAQDR